MIQPEWKRALLETLSLPSIYVMKYCSLSDQYMSPFRGGIEVLQRLHGQQSDSRQHPATLLDEWTS